MDNRERERYSLCCFSVDGLDPLAVKDYLDKAVPSSLMLFFYFEELLCVLLELQTIDSIIVILKKSAKLLTTC